MVKSCQVCGLKEGKSKGWFYRTHCRGKDKLPKDFHLCKDHANEYWNIHDSKKNIKKTLSLVKAEFKNKA